MVRENLQGNPAVERALVGFINHPHAAATQLAKDVEVPELFADEVMHRRGSEMGDAPRYQGPKQEATASNEVRRQIPAGCLLVTHSRPQ
jgi:hypothetical protein